MQSVPWKAQCVIYSILTDRKPSGCVLAETTAKGYGCGLRSVLSGLDDFTCCFAVMEKNYTTEL